MAGTVVKIKQSAVAGRLPTHGTGNATDIVQGELALNTADQKLYSKDSSNAIFEIGGGGASGAVSIATTEFVATSSQTSFAVTYSVSNDHINVYFNGVWLAPTEFTATSGTAVVLDSGAPVGTEIVIQKIQALNLANGSDIDEHEFTATAGQTSFTISGGYTTASDVEVYVNGVKLRAGDFTSTSGTVVVLGSGAVVNDEVTIRIIKISVLTSTVSQTSETGAAIIPAGTTAQRDSSPVAGYLRWNSTLSRAEVYSGSAWADVGQQTLTTEQVQDAIGPMLAGNTETNISVTYDDTNNKIDFVAVGDVTLTGTEILTNKTITAATLSGTHTAASTGTKITGTPTGVSEATLELNTTNSGWDKNQIMFSDSNDKVGTFSGSQDSSRYKTIQTLDPNNTRYSTFTINAGSFVATKSYKIASVGTTDFTAIGASANTVGTNFNANVTTNAGSFVIGTQYKITSLGNTTQAQWNTAAGTSGDTYAVHDTFTAAATGTGTGTVVYTPTTTNLGAGTGTATIQSYAGDNAIYFTKNTIYKDDDTMGMMMEMNMWGAGPQGNRISSFRDYIGFYGTAPLMVHASHLETAAMRLKSNGDEGSLRFYEANNNGSNYIKLVGAATLSGDTTLTLPTSTDTLVGKATTDTLTNKTLTSPVINTGVSGSAILDSDTMSGTSATTLASSESIKAYVDAQILAVPDAVAMSIALG